MHTKSGNLHIVGEVERTMWPETGGTLISILGIKRSIWATVLICRSKTTYIFERNIEDSHNVD